MPIGVDGIDIHVEGEGAEAIVMVHGWPDTYRLWDGQVAFLKDRYRCIRFTLPGFDVAKPRRAFSIDEVSEFIRRVIEQFSPGRKVILLLHDWGCLFGYQFYARHPQLVSRIVGVDIGDTRNLKKALPAREKLYIMAYQLWLSLAWRIGGRMGDWMVLRMKRLMNSPSDERFMGSCMCYPYYYTWFGGEQTYRKQFRRFEPSCPMLFAYAKRKPVMFHTEPWLDELRTRKENGVVAFDTGHWIMLQQPERFNETVSSWLWVEMNSRSAVAAWALGAACALAPTLALGQLLGLDGADLQRRANGVLALMGYMLTPDVTTGGLAISNAATGNPDFGMTTLGGGFTRRKEHPLYLEGTLGYSRYDPTFVSSSGQVVVATQWDAYSATGGVGWDFPLSRGLVVRPIINVSYGRVDARVSASGQTGAGEEIEFLRNGHLDSYGVGGSLVLDYERYRPENEVDVELRYTNIRLQSFGGSAAAVQGNADAQSISFWSRWRAPTGASLLERPLRYVLEFAYTTFLGDLDGVLGFNHLSSFGAGLELDSGARDIAVTRTRLMARYRVGEHVTGWSIGLAVSF